MKRLLLSAVLGLGMAVGSASAQTTVVSEDFSTDAGSLVVTGGPAPTEIDIAGGLVTFTGAGDTGRAYLGTTGTDFSATDFTASIDVVVQDAGGANAFFGLGPGAVAGPGGNSFGEPSLGPTAYYAINANSRNGGGIGVGDFEDVNNGTSVNATPVVGTGTHTLTLIHDATAQTLALSVIVNGVDAGIISTIDTSDNPFDPTSANIFFGGDDGTTFDNFLVTVPDVVAAIPEPTSAALLSFGVLGLVLRRRRS